MRVVLLALAGTACGRIGFDPPDIGITVSPAYPSNGANWNDYVSNDGPDRETASDTPCDPSATPYSACIHGGELRKATIAGAESCTGLTVTDALGVFDWSCRLVDGTPTFYSSLKPDKGLRDLVTASGWNENSVSVTGAGSASSEPSAWWTNPVAALPDNSTAGSGVAILSVPGQIYVLSATQNTDGYEIAADRIAIVTLGAATMLWNAGAFDAHVIRSAGWDHAWIEATIDATAAHDGISLVGGRFLQVYRSSVANGGQNPDHGASLVVDGVASSQIRHFTSYRSLGGGILVGAAATSDHNHFEDTAVSSSGDTGIYLHFGQDDVFDGVTVANSALTASLGGSAGIHLGPYCDGGGSRGNTLIDARVFNNSAPGIFVNSEANRLIDVLVVGNRLAGISLSNACGYTHGTVVANVVAAFNGGSGLEVFDHTMSFTNIVSIGNAGYGLLLGNSNTWSNVAISNSGSGDIDVTAPSTFASNLSVTDTSSCVNPTNLDGVANGTCVPSGSSTASLYYQGSLLADFIGQVADDTVNGSAANGVASFPALSSNFDWVHFEDPRRVWGQWNLAGPWISGTGAILDFRLGASATKIFDNTNIVTMHNGPFAPEAGCPLAVNGGNVVANHNSQFNDGYPDQVYLTNAVEIVSPTSPGYSARGNHDGLCESGEHCLYSPNFGAYQGEGTLATCRFTDGMVLGVTMFGYPTNGL